ncbi:DeoR/GlpR family DNA-binding transcription regulator [Mesorhizobium sp. RCC_202]|uniref:DeoR/GlpR family DNA-binding transcription regulator n=1 Tax=Mesorhizobium sp. RCC_202 TaxID=3239222 RepID=UPI003524A0BD
MDIEPSRLTKKERHELILSEVRRSASIRISKLARRIGVAGETIRRDLIELGDAGLINRTYGGATISLMTSEPVISERGLTLVEERARVGRGAAGLVENGRIVMIDGGSTTYEVARSLSQLRRDLTVITNSVGIASVTGANPSFRVILCPGTYDSREASVLGEDTVEFVRRYNADIAIIGASAVNGDGPSDTISGAAAVKRAMMARSLSAMLVVTNDKFGRSSLERVCALSELSDVVTDREPEAELRAAIDEAGGELHVFA